MSTVQQADPNTSVRFHALDALRAWAMLLGIVLHAAWFMTSRNLMAPMTDVDGGFLYDFILNFIHIFRLQVFFVMAGFFAHLVWHRRGTLKFIQHRLVRIALPLVVAWFVLYPIIMLLYTSAGLQTGQILSDHGVWKTCLSRIPVELSFNPSNFYHLWFLYYLLVIYAIVLFGLFLARKVDRRGAIRRGIDRIFCWSVQSPWGVLLLTAVSTIPLYFEPMWNGLGGFVVFFIPMPAGLVGYLIFFTFGWLLFTHWDMLDQLARNWRTNVMLGVALSFPLFAVTLYADEHATTLYPFLIFENQIGDHRQLVPKEGSSPQLDAQRHVWAFIPRKRQHMLITHSKLTTDQKAGLAMDLNFKLIVNPRFSDPNFWKHVKLPEELAQQVAQHKEESNLMTTAILNRQLLEFAFPDAILSNFMNRPYTHTLKAGFSVGYSLSMWLCVLGLIGVFHRYGNQPSPTSRYIADSAYWIYLIHLPIMMYLETWVGGSQWGFGGVPKFLFYVLTATLLCFISYHYLVRSTLIGRMLNGRRYPFVAWPREE